jgi:hypothetical protein
MTNERRWSLGPKGTQRSSDEEMQTEVCEDKSWRGSYDLYQNHSSRLWAPSSNLETESHEITASKQPSAMFWTRCMAHGARYLVSTMSDVAWDDLPCLCHSSTIHIPASAQPRQLVRERGVGVPATAGTMHVVADASIFREKLTRPG